MRCEPKVLVNHYPLVFHLVLMLSCAKKVAGSGGAGVSAPPSTAYLPNIQSRIVFLLFGPPVLSTQRWLIWQVKWSLAALMFHASDSAALSGGPSVFSVIYVRVGSSRSMNRHWNEPSPAGSVTSVHSTYQFELGKKFVAWM